MLPGLHIVFREILVELVLAEDDGEKRLWVLTLGEGGVSEVHRDVFVSRGKFERNGDILKGVA